MSRRASRPKRHDCDRGVVGTVRLVGIAPLLLCVLALAASPTHGGEAAPTSPEAQSAIVPGSGASFRDCPQCPEMVVIPAGTFMMGAGPHETTAILGEFPYVKRQWIASETVRHPVTIARPLAVGKFEVTRGQFAHFADETGHRVEDSCFTHSDTPAAWGRTEGRSFRNTGYPQTDDDPATCVSWGDAKAYTLWLKKLTGHDYRLLSEAEWEYAARADSATRFGFGDDAGDLCRNGNGADRTGGENGARWRDPVPCTDGHWFTAPVGSFSPNAWGLHDMHGNVWEWVEDSWHRSYDGAPADGAAWTTGGHAPARVVRGGSWKSRPWNMRSAYRTGLGPQERNGTGGFRVARPITP
ncbi:MAG: SUMF1/EgtB/PvdO family nonheme iron enzyme [Rhizobiales bacterium]|nr:SUMF1/EgtB/PvdO family nonheme iron enzyme [Hyphomicrobiales bacterium]